MTFPRNLEAGEQTRCWHLWDAGLPAFSPAPGVMTNLSGVWVQLSWHSKLCNFTVRTCFPSVCWNFLVNHDTGRKLGFPGLGVGWGYRGPQRFFVVGNLEAEVGSTCLYLLFTWRLLSLMYIPAVDGELLPFWKNEWTSQRIIWNCSGCFGEPVL